MSDGHDAPELVDEFVPCVVAAVDDVGDIEGDPNGILR